MMKNLLFLISFLVFSSMAFAQDVVQIAAFDQKVGKEYFQGLSEVKYYTDYQGFVRYYIEETPGKSLSSILSEVQGLGFNKAYIMDLGQLKVCNTCCGTGKMDVGTIKPIVKTVYERPVVAPQCDKPSFVVNSQEDMEKVRYVVNKNPDASLLMIDCPKNQNLNCYLGVRGIQACGFGFYSPADLRKETGCPTSCGIVYLKAADGNFIDIQQTFMEIVKTETTSR